MSWEDGISIATRERCGVCHCVSAIGFHVPDELWRVAVPDYFRETVLCLKCFVSFADERMLRWERSIKFFPVSLALHLDYQESASPPRAWQPIETAPKDTAVLVAVERYDDKQRFVGEARFHSEARGGSWWWANENDGDYHASQIENYGRVLGWQALPDPQAV